MKEKPRPGPMGIAVVYLVVSVIWILFSNIIAAWLAPDMEALALFQAVKGWLFVFVTSVFIFWVLAWAQRGGGSKPNINTTQNALSGLSALFEAIAGSCCDLFWVRDIETNSIEYISHGFEQLWKRSEQELYTNPMVFLDAVHPDDKELAVAAIEDQGGSTHHEHRFRIIWPDGLHRWVKVNVISLKDGRGRPAKQALMFEDITYDLEQINQLRRQRDLAKQYLDVAGAIMVAIDRDEKVVMVNQEGCNILGYPEKEILGRNWFDYFISKDVREIVRNVFHQVVSGRVKSVKNYENPVMIKGGTTRLIQWRNTIIRGENGEFEASLSYGEDVTEKRQAQDGRLRLMRAVEQTVEGIAIINNEGVAEYVNPSFLEITGSTVQQVLGHSIFDYIGQDGPSHNGGLQLSILAKAAQVPYQTKVLRTGPGGKEKHLEMTISPVRETNQLLSGFVLVLRDVTELSLLESKLRQAQKMEAIGTLAGGIAHDFNNILGSIMGYTELAAWDMPTESTEKRHLEQVLMAGERARGLVGQILSFSRQGEQERRPIRLGSIIKETVKLLRASLPATLEIESSLQKETGSVLSDPVQIQQIIMNLATNAAQAIGEQTGKIDIVLQEQFLENASETKHPILKSGIYTLLMVSDTGCGISQEHLDKIFDPYFSTKKPGEGTGLGLAIVHGIVQSHGGAVSVYSEIGKGTTFKVYLPRVASKVSEPAILDYSIYKGNERVLLVDDEQALTDAYSEMLSKMGYQVTACHKPLEALEMFKADPASFDIVITDYAMPAMSGTDLAKCLVEIRSDVPMILCTGFSETISRKMAGSLGFAEFLMKPLLAGQLAQSIRRVMAARQKQG